MPRRGTGPRAYRDTLVARPFKFTVIQVHNGEYANRDLPVRPRRASAFMKAVPLAESPGSGRIAT